ncbi:ParB/RepB/Spo0J family partition protein (plasmid) [Streptomyces sp. NBC_00250]|uniref:ParB/RepB/Spo0J family partition protein n=1 Tax=Streptomyces sp. NBC_00250 TaxID=2903641 RepID=UPI002E29171A|nr:ParB/RepB/Spo0J family partition protein [Streptomyces sp. NBC_00250]
MSKAALLGASSSFQRAQNVSARRAAIDQATSAPTEGVAAPTELPLSAISLNPDNPRSELGDLTDLSNSLRDHGQKTAISIMTRFAYLQANPGRETDLESDTQYVVIDGNSRLAASREAGLSTLKVMLDDDLGADPNGVLESALVANIHRKDLDPLDEAKALQKLLKLHGTQDKLAERLHRTQAWVSQRLALLNLTPELQQRLKDGTEQAKHLRRVGNKKPEDQESRLAEIKAQEEAAKEAQKQVRKTPTASTSTDTAARATTETPPATAAVAAQGSRPHNPVMKTSSESPGAGQPPSPASAHNPVMKTSSESPDAGQPPSPASPHNPVMNTSAVTVPEPRPAGAPDEALPALKNDGQALMDFARENLDADQRSAMLQRYFQLAAGVEEVAQDLGRGLLPKDRHDLALIIRNISNVLDRP